MMKTLFIAVLTLLTIMGTQAQQKRFYFIDKNKDTVWPLPGRTYPDIEDNMYIDPMPKAMRDTLPKPMAIIHEKDEKMCFCWDLRRGYISLTSWINGHQCTAIWKQEDYDKMNKIAIEWNDSGKPLRRWLWDCDRQKNN